MIRLYVAGAAVAASLAGLAWWGHTRYEAGAADVRAEYAERDAAAAAAQDELTKGRARITQGIDHATVRRHSEALRAAAADRAAADSLRDALAAVSRDAADSAATSCADERRTIGVLAGLVNEGASLLAEGAGVGAGLATQATGLREYVARVCQMPVNENP